MTEVAKAVALLWHADHLLPETELTAGELAEQLHSSGLTGDVNVSRLARNLAKSRDTVRDKARGTFRIALSRKPKLDGQFTPFLKRPKVAVSDTVLPIETVGGTREYIERIAHQINGCHDAQFYDACAVLCRRLVESLLIDAFVRAGHASVIQRDGDFVGLDEIITKAKTGSFIKLARNTGNILDKIKEIGDRGAHDRYHIASQQDISEFRSGFRSVVSELLTLAGIK